MADRHEYITEYFDEMVNTDGINAVYVWNEYCSRVRSEDEIYPIDDFDEVCGYMKPWEVARATFYGDFCPVRDYFRFNGYGNLESFEAYELKSYIYTDDMADYAVRNDYDFGIPAIRDILEDKSLEAG